MIIVIVKELRSKTDHYQSNKASGSQIVGIIGKKNKEESSKYASIFDWIPSGPPELFSRCSSISLSLTYGMYV